MEVSVRLQWREGFVFHHAFSHLIPVHLSVWGTFSTTALIQAHIVFTALLNGPWKRQPHRRKQGRTTCSSARSQTNSRKSPAVSSWSATLPAQISLSQQFSWLFFSNWTSLQSLTLFCEVMEIDQWQDQSTHAVAAPNACFFITCWSSVESWDLLDVFMETLLASGENVPLAQSVLMWTLFSMIRYPEQNILFCE